MREDRGLSREEFAKEAGVGESTVANVERSRTVRLKTARKVAGVFGVHPRELGRIAG